MKLFSVLYCFKRTMTTTVKLAEKEFSIKAPWGKISVVAWGNSSDPPVLACHGESDSAASFKSLVPLLPKNFYYLGIELPGHGRSDPLPRGMPVSLLDLVHSWEVVRRHFQWDQFTSMTHSAACIIGRLYNLTHRGRISRAIELDQITPDFGITSVDVFVKWYERFYANFYAKYEIINAPKEKGPTYTWDEAINKVIGYRELTPETARRTIERWSEPAGDNRIRFTLDQRSKNLMRPPFTPEQIRALWTSLDTPTVAVVARGSIKKGFYKINPFLLENHGNYRVFFVDGYHDVHVTDADRVAPYVSQFLTHGIDGLDRKAKL